MNHKVLNELLKKGDEHSFTLIFEALYQPLVAYMMQYVDKAADAEDILMRETPLNMDLLKDRLIDHFPTEAMNQRSQEKKILKHK